MIKNQLDDLIAFVRTEDRVCPQPHHWHRLAEKIDYKIKSRFSESLTEREEALRQWWQLPPLILNGWIFSSSNEKHLRLLEQLRFLSKHEILFDEAERILRGLTLDDWYREPTTSGSYYDAYDPTLLYDEE
jgi:hypothetical protein